MSLPWSEYPDEAMEELRIASVFNGGVSLAVWMGGATHELNRLVHSSRSDGPYRALLELTGTKVVADVMAGTSAGGINGAALAISQANPNANLDLLRGVWLEQGRFDSLLRRPFQGQPTSLLQGDEFFLPALSSAMSQLATREGDAQGANAELDLQITTSLLEPSDRIVPDDLGQLTYQQVHAAQFTFTRDDFGKDALPTTARALALAARASASFPLAFEPTFVPVNNGSRDPQDIRPDMARWASWCVPHDTTADLSRYAADGGLLANTPLQHALRSIRDRPALGPVRRLLLLVYPHAQLTPSEVDVRRDEAPTVTGGLMGMVSAMRSHSGQTFLEEIDAHNRSVLDWRGGRESALPEHGELVDLFSLVGAAWGRYGDMRRRLAAATLAKRIQHVAWSYDRTRRAAYLAQLDETGPSAYLPDAAPPATTCLGLADHLPEGTDACPLTEWRWGHLVAIGVCDAIESVVRSASLIATPAQLTSLRAARAVVIASRAEIRELRENFDTTWTGPHTAGVEPDLTYWSARLAALRLAMAEPDPATKPGDEAALAALGEHHPDLVDAVRAVVAEHPGARIAARVWEAVRALRSVIPTLEPMWGMGGAVVELNEWRELLTAARLAEESADPDLRLLIRFLALDTATWLTANGGDQQGGQLPINSAQLSLAVQHAWAQASTRPIDKAAGLNLGHFAGFLKRSWRMNDWIWGRLDAARLLCDVTLSPERLRRLAAVEGDSRSPDELARLALETLGEALGDTSDVGEAMLAELTEAFDSTASQPLRLKATAERIALSVQRQIILEELPFLRSAILADINEKQNHHSRGQLFLDEHKDLYEDVRLQRRPADVLADEALAAFDRAGIGREVLRDEVGSDAMIQTATNTIGVLATVLSSDQLGIRVLQSGAKSVRGAFMLPYWTLQGLTSGGTIARLLARLAVVVGGVLLVLGLFNTLGDNASSAATAIGAAVLLAVLGYSALRSGTLLHGVVLVRAPGAHRLLGMDSRGRPRRRRDHRRRHGARPRGGAVDPRQPSVADQVSTNPRPGGDRPSRRVPPSALEGAAARHRHTGARRGAGLVGARVVPGSGQHHH